MPVESSPDDFIQKVAARMKHVRKAMGFNSYEKFTIAKNLNRTQYGKWERGQAMKISSLPKIFEALNMSAKEFFSEGFD